MDKEKYKFWNDFCFYMNRLHNSPEHSFQYVAEHIFEKFGWSLTEGEIISQEIIQVGSTNCVKPDIIYSKQ